MAWQVEFTRQFEKWWEGLSGEEQKAVAAKVLLLEEVGPSLGRPHADTVRGSRHPNMKELVAQSGGNPYRVLFAFDPRRVAILLLGGQKGGNVWYKGAIPAADKLYDEHLATLRREKSL